MTCRPGALAVAAFSCVTWGASALLADEAPTFADREDGAEADETERGLGMMLNPLAIAAGVFGGDLDFVVVRRIALSAEGAVFQLGDGGTSTALGVGLLVYPTRSAFHGLVLEPRAVYTRPLRQPPFRFDWDANVVGFGGVAGWQWAWDYGFTVRLGAGGMKFIGAARAPGLPLGRDGVDVVLDGSFGWLF